MRNYLAGLAFLWMVVAAALCAQSSQGGLTQRDPAAFAREEASQRKITLHVVVTDAAGRAVEGLQAKDFTVLENQSPLPVESFRVVHGAEEQPPVEVILLIDALNPPFEDIQLQREGVEKYLRRDGGKLPLPVSVVFLSNGGVQLNKASQDGMGMAKSVASLPATIRTMGAATGANGWVERMSKSTDDLERILRYEASRPGRKLLVWMGPGWPLVSFNKELTARQQTELFDTAVSLNTKLRLADVTLYNVQPLDMSQGTEQRTFLWEAYKKGVPSPKQVDAPNVALQVMAYETGGQVLNNVGDVAAQIAKCVADAGRYYDLIVSAAPGHEPIELRDLQVNAGRAGSTARTLKDFYLQH